MTHTLSKIRFVGLALLTAFAFSMPAQALDLDRIERRAGGAISGFLDVARKHYDGDSEIGSGSRSFRLKSLRGGSGKLKSLGLKKGKLKKLKLGKGKLKSGKSGASRLSSGKLKTGKKLKSLKLGKSGGSLEKYTSKVSKLKDFR